MCNLRQRSVYVFKSNQMVVEAALIIIIMLILSLFDGKKHLLVEISFFGILNAVLPYDDKNNEKIT